MIEKCEFEESKVHNRASMHIIHNTLWQAKIPHFIDDALPLKKRGKYQRYSSSDSISALLTFFLFGHKRFSQMQFIKHSNYRSPFYQSEISYHTVKDKIIEFEEDGDSERKMVDGVNVSFGIFRNRKLNSVNIDLIEFLNLLPKDEPLILDVDTTLIPTRCKDATWHYEGKMGLNPLVISINRIVVLVEIRTGCVHPSTMLDKAVINITKVMRKKGYNIQGVRIDAAGYVKAYASTFESLRLKYYIRAKTRKADFLKMKPNHVIMNGMPALLAERKRKFGKIKSRFIYNNANKNKRTVAVITNDFDSSSADIIKTYQDRGSSEQVIRDLKDFGWKTMVFHTLAYNAAYMSFCVLVFNLFKFITCRYSELLKDIDPDFVKKHATPKYFRLKFLSCEGEWKGKTLVLHDQKMMPIFNHLLSA